MRIVIVTLSILFAFCVLAVSLFNYVPVTVQLWPATPDYTYNTFVSWVIFFSAVAGIVFTGIIAILEGSKIRLSNARLRAEIRRLKQEIDTLRRPSFELDVRPPSPQALPPDPVEVDEEVG